MQTSYIEPSWLEVSRAGTFFYPTAGDDTHEPMNFFADYIDDFHFCDIRYRDLSSLKLLKNEEPNKIYFEGPLISDLCRRGGLREVERGRRIEVYNRIDRAPHRIVRRRGFGQMGLAEFPDRSLSVFMHRGDSLGEGGSNAFFLSDRRKNYPPLSNLFTKLQRKLSNRALVISDGSNTDKKFLTVYTHNHKRTSGEEAFAAHEGKYYIHGDFNWECVGWMSYRYGPTLIWGVTKRLIY